MYYRDFAQTRIASNGRLLKSSARLFDEARKVTYSIVCLQTARPGTQSSPLLFLKVRLAQL